MYLNYKHSDNKKRKDTFLNKKDRRIKQDGKKQYIIILIIKKTMQIHTKNMSI